MKTVCKTNQCTGCNACINSCSHNAIIIDDNGIELNAIIDESKCINCGLCQKVCLNNNILRFNKSLYYYEGWALDDSMREKSSSGGFASCIAKYYLENHYVVYTCCFNESKLVYQKCNNIDDLIYFAGSKYVKSDTGFVYKQIKQDLLDKKYVLFIGLPCHVGGLKLYLGNLDVSKLLTVDLICHGSPSFKLFESYLNEKKVDKSQLKSFKFRKKTSFKSVIDNDSNYMYWNNPFLDGLTYSENCYSCHFAQQDRISDITIGDSWGSKQSKQERNHGISLVIANTVKGNDTIHSLNFNLEEINKAKAISFNRQLEKPSEKPSERNDFVNEYKKTGCYINSIKKVNKKKIIVYRIKHIYLFNLARKIMRGGVIYSDPIK